MAAVQFPVSHAGSCHDIGRARVLTIIKVIVYWLIGLFLAPIVILWNVIKIIYQVIRFVLEK